MDRVLLRAFLRLADCAESSSRVPDKVEIGHDSEQEFLRSDAAKNVIHFVRTCCAKISIGDLFRLKSACSR